MAGTSGHTRLVDLDAAKALPEAVRAITTELVQTQHKVACASAYRLVLDDDPIPVVRFLGHTRLTSLFFLAAESKSGIRLISFKKQKVIDRPLLRARVHLELTPAPFLEQVDTSARRLSFSVTRPSLVVRGAPGGRGGGLPLLAAADEQLTLAVGPEAEGRLVVVFRGGRRRNPRFFYSATPGEPYAEVERDAATDTWPLRPFSDLFVAVRRFVREGFDANQDQPVPDLAIGPPDTHLRTIVDAVVSSFKRLRETISTLQPRSEPGLPGFELDGFLVEVLLRTTKDGDIVKGEDENPFHLLLQFRWQVRADADQIRVAVGPPDFLVSGQLLSAFGTLFRREDFATHMRRTLSRKGWSPARISVFLDDLLEAVSTERCSVFRVDRKREIDTDIVVVPPGATGHGWIFAANFELSRPARDAPREVRLDGGVRVLHEGDEGSRRVDDLFVQYLSWLCAELHQWTKALR